MAAPVEAAIAREDLDIRLGLRDVAVDARLLIENRGPARAFDVGFPCVEKVDAAVTTLACRTRPRVEVDGRTVAARLRWSRERPVAGRGRAGDWVWRMSLREQARVTLRVRYVSRLVNDRYDIPFHGLALLHYRLTTGAAWAGTIGELHMRLDTPSDAIADIAPEGYARSPRRITWDLRDVEPNEDLIVRYHFLVLGMDLDDPRRRTQAVETLRRDGADEMLRFYQLLERHYHIPVPPRERVERTLAETLRMYEAPPPAK